MGQCKFATYSEQLDYFFLRKNFRVQAVMKRQCPCWSKAHVVESVWTLVTVPGQITSLLQVHFSHLFNRDQELPTSDSLGESAHTSRAVPETEKMLLFSGCLSPSSPQQGRVCANSQVPNQTPSTHSGKTELDWSCKREEGRPANYAGRVRWKELMAAPSQDSSSWASLTGLGWRRLSLWSSWWATSWAF